GPPTERLWMLSTWSFPTKIVFGASSSEPLAEVAKSLGMKRPLVVTDPGIVKSGLLDGVTASLARAKIPWQLFDRVESNITIPSVALADPSLTLRLPPHLTAATGMDAMTHNLEAYLAAGIHPMCDAIGLKGVEICRRYLPRAVSNGGDLEARSQMMVAAIMGG